jgi:hypothetical protein
MLRTAFLAAMRFMKHPSTHKGIPQEGGVFSNWGKRRNKGLLLTAVACPPQGGIPTQAWCRPKFVELSMFQMQQV